MPRSRPPREFVALVAFVAVVSAGIVVGWTFFGSRSPERLADREAATIAGACTSARTALAALPHPSPRTGPDRVARIRAENAIITTMVEDFDAVPVAATTPERALREWSADWRAVVAARERYAHDLESEGRARFVVPAERGVKPVTVRMDDYVRQNHPHLDACFTATLELETVEGAREYEETRR